MNKQYDIGHYEYSKWTLALSASLLLAGVGYGVATKKSALGILAFALLGSVTGFSIGMIIKAPKRIS